MSVGNLLAALLLIGYLSMDGAVSMDIIATLLQDPSQVPNGWYALMLLQATAHVLTFLVPSLLYWYLIERRRWADFDFRPASSATTWLMVFLLVVAFMPFNSLMIEWNNQMSLPEGLQGVEQWMRAKEDQLGKLTKHLVQFESAGQLLIAIVVIGFIPSVGEEVLFRGVLQRKLAEEWASVHTAIWVSAIVFSAIHVQFYGFLPRMLLGAMFGYLYYWSGRLSIAIFAHFVNNGFTVFMMYLYHRKAIPIDIEDTETVSLVTALLSLGITGALLYGVWVRKNRPLESTEKIL
ncbi:CPBP family intramembrane metalloprotease [Rhabdobacter roseus]